MVYFSIFHINSWHKMFVHFQSILMNYYACLCFQMSFKVPEESNWAVKAEPLRWPPPHAEAVSETLNENNQFFLTHWCGRISLLTNSLLNFESESSHILNSPINRKLLLYTETPDIFCSKNILLYLWHYKRVNNSFLII